MNLCEEEKLITKKNFCFLKYLFSWWENQAERKVHMDELKKALKKDISKHKELMAKDKHELITDADLAEIESNLKSKLPFIKGSRFTHAQNLQFTSVSSFGIFSQVFFFP